MSDIGEARPRAFGLSTQVSRRTVVKRGLLLGASIPVIGSLLAACGEADDDDEPVDAAEPAAEADDEEEEADEPEAEDEEEDEEIEAPERGDDILEVGLSSDVATMDPHQSGAAVDRQLYHAIFSPLVNIDVDLEIIPELVEDWEIADGTVYSFTLLPDITFHDGSPLNAETAQWNFERMMSPESQRRSELTPVESVEVVDELTFEIHLSEPFAPFLSLLTDRAGMMVSREAVEASGDEFITNPVGTGPFRFVEWVQREFVELERFDDYFKDGLPYLAGITYRVIPDDSVKMTNLRTGDVHLIDAVPPREISGSRDNPDLKVGETMGLGYRDVILQTEREPFDSMELRQALCWATDRDAIHEAVFFSTGMPAQGPIAPGHFAFDENFAPYSFDPVRARELLSDAGYPDGIEISMKVQNTPLETQIAQLLQAQWLEAGIDVELEMLDFTTLLEDLRGKDFTALQISWSGRIDPDGNMFPQFICGGAFNDGDYCNDEVDEALNVGRTSTEDDERLEAYQEAQRILVDEAAMVFLHHDAIVQAWLPEVEGFEVFADGMIRPVNVSLGG